MMMISDEANHSNRLRLDRLQTYCTLHVCNVVVNQAIYTKQDAKVLDRECTTHYQSFFVHYFAIFENPPSVGLLSPAITCSRCTLAGQNIVFRCKILNLKFPRQNRNS